MEVRERIIEESGQLFGKYGIRSMTMDALSEEMGISKRTIYERFRDKDTLLLEVVRYYKQRRMEEALRIIAESEHAISAMFRIMHITVLQVKQMNPLFFHDLKKYHTRVFRKLETPGEIRDLTITGRLLRAGTEQRIFREDVNIDIVNRALHAMFDLFNHDSPLVEAGYGHKEMFEHMIIPYLRGISTPRGIELLDKEMKTLEKL